VLLAAAAAGVALGTGGPDAERASDVPDTIVHNGRITTLDERGSTVQALAILDGVIVASGSDDAVRELAGDGTRQIDLGGRRVIPGLIDANLQGVHTGSSECFSRSPRFDAIFRRTEALKAVANRAQRTPAGRWLFQLGAGWHVEQLDVPGMLSREELDSLAPSHPVYLRAAGFEGGQLNTRGLRALGLETGDPGVARGPGGRPTGQVTGPADARARAAVAKQASALSLDEHEACTRDLIQELNRRGLTAWDDPGGGDPSAVNRLHRAGELNARVRLNLSCPGLACLAGPQIGEVGHEELRVGGIGDEVLRAGPRGVYPPGPYRRILGAVARREWAFEHSATRATTQHGMIEQWERVNARHPIAGLRWRWLRPGGGPTEPNPDALTRLRDLDAGVVPTHLGVLGGNEHPPYKRIHASGTRACLGSGAPEAPYAPFVHLWYAVSGRTYDETQGGVAPEERLDRMQALELATRRCDWFMSLDGRVGALEVGRLADLVVLGKDLFRVPVDEIRTLTSVLTMVGGRVVYAEGPFADLESTASTMPR
jgi:predicted amidohydrolase YtcJ